MLLVPGTRRSRSAPARSSESPPDSCKQSPSVSRKAMSPSPRAWVDTRHMGKVKEEPLDIKSYDANDVERFERRRTDEKEVRFPPISCSDLLAKFVPA